VIKGGTAVVYMDRRHRERKRNRAKGVFAEVRKGQHTTFALFNSSSDITVGFQQRLLKLTNRENKNIRQWVPERYPPQYGR